MPLLRARIALLSVLGHRAKTEVLGAALRAASLTEQAELAEPLIALASEHPEGLALPHVVSRYEGLNEQQKLRVRQLIGSDWQGLLGVLLNDADPIARANVLLAAGQVPVVLSACTFVRAMADKDAGVADAAEQAVGEVFRLGQNGSLRNEEHAEVQRAVELSIESFDAHRRTGILRQAMKLCAWGGTDGPRAMKWMNDERHPAQMVMRGLIRKSDEPAMRGCAWAWLKYPALASACMERLTKTKGADDHTPVLERAYLALNPVRAEKLVASARVEGDAFAATLPRVTQIESLTPAARRGLPMWIDAVPVPERLKDAATAVLLTDVDPTVRHALARQAITRSVPPSCLLDLVFDRDSRVAVTAANAVLARNRRDVLPTTMRARLMSAIARSGHEELRRFALQLENGSRRARASSLDELEAVASRIRQDPAQSPRTAASAVAAIARLDDPARGEVLARCLELPDARVRANAIDGLVRVVRGLDEPAQQDRIIEVLLDKAIDPNHRIRANAVRGLLTAAWIRRDDRTLLAAGSRTLAGLLSDARVMHRVAGLWLTERVGGALSSDSELLDRVKHVGERAIDPMEKSWAARAKGRIETEVRVQWAERAQELSVPMGERAEVAA